MSTKSSYNIREQRRSDSRQIISNNPGHMSYGVEAGVHISDEAKSRIAELLRSNQGDKLTCDELYKLYHEKYGEYFDIHQCGCSSFLEVLTYMQGVAKIQRDPGTRAYYVVSPNSNSYHIVESQVSNSANRKIVMHDDDDEHNEEGEDFFTDHTNSNESHKVVITAVKNPDEIYIQFVDKSEELDTFEKSIKSYMKRRDDWVLELEKLQCGEMYAAKIHGKWKRAKLLSIKDVKHVAVLLTDYGIVTECKIKYLATFNDVIKSIPTFAMKVGLSGFPTVAGDVEYSTEFINSTMELVIEVSKYNSFIICTSKSDWKSNGNDDIVRVQLKTKDGMSLNDVVIKLYQEQCSGKTSSESGHKLASLCKKLLEYDLKGSQKEVSNICQRIESLVTDLERNTHLESIKNHHSDMNDENVRDEEPIKHH